jgi:hypothetical protein
MITLVLERCCTLVCVNLFELRAQPTASIQCMVKCFDRVKPRLDSRLAFTPNAYPPSCRLFAMLNNHSQETRSIGTFFRPPDGPRTFAFTSPPLFGSNYRHNTHVGEVVQPGDCPQSEARHAHGPNEWRQHNNPLLDSFLHVSIVFSPRRVSLGWRRWEPHPPSLKTLFGCAAKGAWMETQWPKPQHYDGND